MAALIEEILGAQAGTAVEIQPDHIILTDGPSHRAMEGILRVAAPEKVTVIYDHDVPAGSSEGAAIFGEINHFAHRFGCRFVQSVGVGRQWMLNEMVQLGQIVVGGGTHNGIYGAIGALGVGLSPARLARALEEGKLQMVVPETVTVELTGALVCGSALDLGLLLLQKLGRRICGKALQFVGGDRLTRQEKAILCGVACGTGAFTALFSDGGVPDLCLPLSEAVPMVQLPCGGREKQAAAAICPLSEAAGMEVQAGQIGGFTGGTIDDLRMAARWMEGQTLARGFRLSIVPATSRDYLMALNEGLIERFIVFNAQVLAAGERSVVRQGAGVIDQGERLVTTGLYTFDGCMGALGSEVYTASVESVVKAAVTGRL